MKGLKETELLNFLNCALVHICVQQEGEKSYEKPQGSSNLHTRLFEFSQALEGKQLKQLKNKFILLKCEQICYLEKKKKLFLKHENAQADWCAVHNGTYRALKKEQRFGAKGAATASVKQHREWANPVTALVLPILRPSGDLSPLHVIINNRRFCKQQEIRLHNYP